MVNLYLIIGLSGSFIFGFLVGLFFGIGKLEMALKKIKKNFDEKDEPKSLNSKNYP
jgi:hypothetical protein